MKDQEKKEAIDIEKLSINFEKFKIEVKEIITKEFLNIQSTVKSTMKVYALGFLGFFGFLFYFVDDRYNTRLEKLESVSYISARDIFVKEVKEEIKNQMSSLKIGIEKDKKHNILPVPLYPSKKNFKIKKRKRGPGSFPNLNETTKEPIYKEAIEH